MKWKILIAISIMFMNMFLVGLFYEPYEKVPYATFADPSGRYVLSVHKKRLPFIGQLPSFPGQGGDGAAVAILKTAAGEHLGQANVDMANLVQDPQWEFDRVWVRLVLVIKYDGQ